MVAPTEVVIEAGAKRAFASALDWPGWCRSGRTEEAALSALSDYAGRYAPVAAQAGIAFPAALGKHLQVVQRLPGDATTDFGAPSQIAAAERPDLSATAAGRIASLVQAAWGVLEQIVAGAPLELRKGPRGGGRDRDKIVAHVANAEAAYGRKIGLKLPAPTDAASTAAGRALILEVLRSGRPGPLEVKNGWPLRYTARRIAWHALDHAWEIEDRSERDG
jgi:hypothetical protein